MNLNHIINGQKIKGDSTNAFNIHNPATDAVISRIQGASAKNVNQAVDAASEAFKTWSQIPPAQRAQYFFNYRDLIIKNMDELATLISQEHGKTFADAIGEVKRGLEIVEFCTAISSHLKSDFSNDVSRAIDSYNIRFPLGVCAGITPFNFPAMVPMWMYPIAIAAGNTFVLKLSERTPSCGLRLTELFEEAGVPKGVLNAVVGDKEAVDAILHNDKVKAVSFVGSTQVGSYIYQEGCQHKKRVQALCGAKNHLVVMPDADLSLTADAILGAAYGSAGERCMAISVVIAVGDQTADALIEKLSPMIKQLKMGQYDEPGVEMGPVITQAAQQRILSYIDAGVKAGATLCVDGRAQQKDEGYFIGGCLFDHVTSGMSIYQDEIFGPVLCVVRVPDYDQALQLIKDHEYGNGAAIFTRDGDSARHFSMHAEAGMVGVNVPIPVPVAHHSFGGWKNSLYGSNAIHGMEGVRFYTRLKTITARWPSGIREGAEFNFQSSRDV